MAIDDPLDVRLRHLEEDVQNNVDRDLSSASISGILSLFPVAGAAINSLIHGKAQRNIHRRVMELFVEMGKRLREIKESVPDESYFGSEQFQTLLALAYEQLQTTHDEMKRKMLANALANSGSAEFRDDNANEQYVRTLRDLGTQDLLVLSALKTWPQDAAQITRTTTLNGDPRDEILCSITRLAGFGLVAESFAKKSPPTVPTTEREAARAFVELATKTPTREYQISSYGQRFLKFLSAWADDS